MKRNSKIHTGYCPLERKNLLASIYLAPDTGILYIAGDSGDNVGEVRVTGGNVVAEIDNVNFSGASSSVKDIVFIGYDGDDTFTNLSSRSSSMYGHRGNDTLIGGGGDDDLVGGPGNDSIRGNDGDDRLVGVSGDDIIDGGEGNDRIFGTAGENTLYGRKGDDTIYGGEDADEIHGNEGIDKIFALGGDDVLYTGSGGIEGGQFAEGDLAMGHGGNDKFFGESGLDIFWGGSGHDEMVGGSGENRMHGQQGDDVITGGGKADYITGADGDDILEGGKGLDYFNVGNGSDTIVYSDISYSPSRVVLGDDVRVSNEVVSGATWLKFSDRTISANQADYSPGNEINFSELNSFRKSKSKALLSKPQDLANYARNWSLEMGRRDNLQHSPSSQQLKLLTNGRTRAGENVGWVTDIGQTEAEVGEYFHNAWRESSKHYKNMLSGDHSEVGIGIVKVGGKWWATQIYVG